MDISHRPTKREALGSSSFGRRVAEEEIDALSRYFVETDFWKRLFHGEIDVVYGPKGSGKSALYALLNARRDELFDRGILLAAGENPRGAPAFRDLTADPPATEKEFVYLWKLYLLCVISGHLDEYGITGKGAAKIRASLEPEGLLPRGKSLNAILRMALDYVRRFTQPEGVEGEVELDSASGAPSAVKGRIIFSEPSTREAARGRVSVDQLLAGAEATLEENDLELWLILDRLDVAFADSAELEENALRALFRVYLDLLEYDALGVKVFLRTDIWRRITRTGFREASHITRHVTIEWDRRSLLHLIVSRAVNNESLRRLYDVTVEAVLQSADAQRAFFYRLCPDQVDVGPNKSKTLDWVLGRIRDGKGVVAPRELIHLFNALREKQLRRVELGEDFPDGEELFVRPAFKEALVEVSRTRLEQTLFAEYPRLRPYLETLQGEKTLHNSLSLARIWRVQESEATAIAEELVEIGFFETRGSKEAPQYWVPFLYRDALDLVQGSADEIGGGRADQEDDEQLPLDAG